MKENFCDYETSKMLKELGFDEGCSNAYLPYDQAKTLNNYLPKNWNGDQADYIDPRKCPISAPLWQQAKQWLWDQHKIWVETENDYDIKFHFFVYMGKGKGLGIHNDEVCFDSPILAETEGIKAAVKYLWGNKQK